MLQTAVSFIEQHIWAHALLVLADTALAVAVSVLLTRLLFGLRCTRRYAYVVVCVLTAGSAALQTAAEEKRAALDSMLGQAAKEADSQEAYESAIEAALPENVEWADGVLSWEETDGFRSLNCALETQPLDAEERTRWIHFELTAVTEEVW